MAEDRGLSLRRAQLERNLAEAHLALDRAQQRYDEAHRAIDALAPKDEDAAAAARADAAQNP